MEHGDPGLASGREYQPGLVPDFRCRIDHVHRRASRRASRRAKLSTAGATHGIGYIGRSCGIQCLYIPTSSAPSPVSTAEHHELGHGHFLRRRHRRREGKYQGIARSVVGPFLAAAAAAASRATWPGFSVIVYALMLVRPHFWHAENGFDHI
ncbi:hypothetical protein RJ55_06415 [Drechmeria coniospora]|nr:hypothetical protein RJ55_06415 [Drechmeria coniospora]